MADFAGHLAADRGRLPGIAPDAIVTGLRFGLSDPHAGGRTVAEVRFSDGGRLAYKPRSLSPEVLFYDIAARLAGEPGLPDQRHPAILDAGDHGWMEWIAAAPCATEAEAADFYRRIGGLAALLRLLRGGDIHPENLIAAGPYPVLVDLECLFQPSPADLGAPDLLLDPQPFQNGLMPAFASFDGGATMVPIAGAGAGQVPLRPLRTVAHAGTDWAHMAQAWIPSFADGPTLGAEPLDIRDHADDFAEGYRVTLLAIARRQDLIPDDLAAVEVRYLAASTNVYAMVLERALAPAALASEDAFQAAVSRAGRRTPMAGAPETWAALVGAETEAMDGLDVPAFRFRPDRPDIAAAGGGLIRGAFLTPMARRVRDEHAGLTAEGGEAEAAALRACLARSSEPAGPRDGSVSERDVLRALTDRIAELALPAPGGPTWVRLWEQIPGFVAPAGPGLMYGAGGVAIALAEAGRALDDERLVRLSLDALAPWRRVAADGRAAELASWIGPGWGRGLGGMIAAFAWCGQLLEEARLLDEAEFLAQAAGAALAHPGVPDVLDGAAGLALGGQVLARARPTPALAAMLTACGEVMLARSDVSDGLRSWPQRGRPGLPGLSHGACGMAAALAGVATADGDPGWRAAAAEALAYEDTLFDPAEQNWAAAGDARPFASKWCHGAPGAALARHAAAELIPELAETQDVAIATALATAAARPLADCDDLCCGEAGRLEVLTVMAGRRGDAACRAAADAALDARLADWRCGAVRTLSRQVGARDDPSLFRGLAGPAHLLARRLAPDHAVPVLMPLRAPEAG
jgi:type 2 lantibiotic biosynthesis protein LanM